MRNRQARARQMGPLGEWTSATETNLEEIPPHYETTLSHPDATRAPLVRYVLLAGGQCRAAATPIPTMGREAARASENGARVYPERYLARELARVARGHVRTVSRKRPRHQAQRIPPESCPTHCRRTTGAADVSRRRAKATRLRHARTVAGTWGGLFSQSAAVRCTGQFDRVEARWRNGRGKSQHEKGQGDRTDDRRHDASGLRAGAPRSQYSVRALARRSQFQARRQVRAFGSARPLRTAARTATPRGGRLPADCRLRTRAQAGSRSTVGPGGPRLPRSTVTDRNGDGTARRSLERVHDRE